MNVKTDFLVLGSGIAGLSFALKVCEYGSVAIVTKKDKIESSTNYAQGGIATVLGPDDSFDLHSADTLTVGCGLSHPDIVELVVHDGPSRIDELVAWGVNFTRNSSRRNGSFDLGREGGHSRRRILHAQDLGPELRVVLVPQSVAHAPRAHAGIVGALWVAGRLEWEVPSLSPRRAVDRLFVSSN